MSEPFIGQIMPVGFNFPPRGWAHCDGQLLPISSNSALFSLLGTTFGGDGRTTFALPDLRGRILKHVGTGPGLQPVSWGQKGGNETVNISVAQMPSHNHTATLHGESTLANSGNPADRMLAFSDEANGHNIYAQQVPNDDQTMHAGSVKIANTGGGQSVDIRNPYLGIYVCIALVGVYPSRS